MLDGDSHSKREDAFVTLAAGQLTFVPRNVVHTPANLTDRPACYLLICTPDGFERRFDPHFTGRITDGRPYPETHVVGPTIAQRLATGS